MKKIIFILLFLMPFQIFSSGFLPDYLIFETFKADPRRAAFTNGVRVMDSSFDDYENSLTLGSERSYWVFSLGDTIPLYVWDMKNWGKVEVSLSACVWSVFSILDTFGEPDHMWSTTINSDFRIGVPVTYRYKDLSFKISMYHESSHLGDELIVRSGIIRKEVGTEVLELFTSWDILKELRVYGGLCLHMSSSDDYSMAPVYFEYGIEYKPFNKIKIDDIFIQPFGAIHFRNHQEYLWNFDVSISLGAEFYGNNSSSRHIAFSVEYYNGMSREGQFSHEKTHYFNFLMSFNI